MAHRRWEAHSRLSACPQTTLRFVIRFLGSLRSPPREGGLSASSSEYAGQVQSPPFLRYACCRLRLRPQSSGRPTRLHKKPWSFLLSIEHVLFRSPGPKRAACGPWTSRPPDALAALQVPNPAKGSYAPASPDRVPTWRRGNE